MFLGKLRVSIAKLIIPFFYKIFQFLKANTRAINFLKDKKINANNSHDFQKSIDSLLKKRKLIGLDVGAQGGFNSDKFFPDKYNEYFEPILVDPMMKTSLKSKERFIITKGLWSSKCLKKLFILGKRPHSSSMYEPDEKALSIFGFKNKDLHLFEITKTEDVECDTISSSLKSLDIKNLDYLKIDTQGAELEILKGLENFKPLMIKCEIQIFKMYKNQPAWTEVTGLLNKLGYMICDWRKIGSNATRTPVEMDMIFIPNFVEESGKKIIMEREREFTSLMLLSGQIKLLKELSKILNLRYSEFYNKIEDKYFN